MSLQTLLKVRSRCKFKTRTWWLVVIVEYSRSLDLDSNLFVGQNIVANQGLDHCAIHSQKLPTLREEPLAAYYSDCWLAPSDTQQAHATW